MNIFEKEKRSNGFTISLVILTAFALFVIVGLFYLKNLLADYSHDSVRYSMSLENNSLYSIFQSHHLYYNYFKWCFYNFLKGGGFTGRAILTSQAFNACLGALGIAFLFLIVFYITREYFTSLLSALVVSSCFGYWYDSTFAGVRMGVIFLIPILFLLIYLMKAEKVTLFKGVIIAVLIALFHSLTVFMHQAHLMFLAVIFLGFMLGKERWGKKFLFFAVYFIIFAIYVAVSFYKTAVYVGVYNPAEFKSWFEGYAAYGIWGQFTKSSIPLAIHGISTVFVNDLSEKPKVLFGANNIDFTNMLFLIPKFFLLYLIGSSFRIFRKYWKILVLCLVWLIEYVIFFTWWEPSNFEFWIYPLAPAVIIMAISISDFLNCFKNQYVRYAWKAVFIPILFCFIALFFLYNYIGSIIPMHNKENVYAVKIIQEAERISKSDNDLFVCSETNIPYNLKYFLNKKIVTPVKCFERTKSDEEKAYNILTDLIKENIQSGHDVFLQYNIANADDYDAVKRLCPNASKEKYYSFFQEKFNLVPLFYMDKKYLFWKVELK